MMMAIRPSVLVVLLLLGVLSTKRVGAQISAPAPAFPPPAAVLPPPPALLTPPALPSPPKPSAPLPAPRLAPKPSPKRAPRPPPPAKGPATSQGLWMFSEHY
ncbi:hypothetical protein AXG93_3856s1000 [Marchantia polymorpha subsp. ruderalis]|uniref:Uncharacterized protein n=1 Tax=Marchantia polymorpha subsp. ruderalis TaxID=1480154 RepID=A0A176VXA6_MARPO|nr:hypothetical protein AXG93_3856s1000 [Marchantia polymorpha subsp. ruderalis]